METDSDIQFGSKHNFSLKNCFVKIILLQGSSTLLTSIFALVQTVQYFFFHCNLLSLQSLPYHVRNNNFTKNTGEVYIVTLERWLGDAATKTKILSEPIIPSLENKSMEIYIGVNISEMFFLRISCPFLIGDWAENREISVIWKHQGIYFPSALAKRNILISNTNLLYKCMI